MAGPSNIPDRPSHAPDRERVASAGRRAQRVLTGLALAGILSVAYMAFEAQWVRCRRADLPVPGLPLPWSGLTVLHLSDVHAGTFMSNERSLAKVIRWAEPAGPDLVFLTGDIVGDPKRSKTCLELLGRLHPPLGMFAVTGNHEYGLSKAPLARSRDAAGLWTEAGVTLLSDSCVTLPAREGTSVLICGADYVSGGFGLPAEGSVLHAAGRGPSHEAPAAAGAGGPPAAIFPILLIHDPPAAGSPLTAFPLVFAGHTHGGQLRVPGPSGLTPVHMKDDVYLGGVHRWGAGTLVVSRGIGTSFLPLRLLTRPEATLWRLVYTSSKGSAQADRST